MHNLDQGHLVLDVAERAERPELRLMDQEHGVLPHRPLHASLEEDAAHTGSHPEGVSIHDTPAVEHPCDVVHQGEAVKHAATRGVDNEVNVALGAEPFPLGELLDALLDTGLTNLLVEDVREVVLVQRQLLALDPLGLDQGDLRHTSLSVQLRRLGEELLSVGVVPAHVGVESFRLSAVLSDAGFDLAGGELSFVGHVSSLVGPSPAGRSATRRGAGEGRLERYYHAEHSPGQNRSGAPPAGPLLRRSPPGRS